MFELGKIELIKAVIHVLDANFETPICSSFEVDADDLLAVCIQHEMDHLKGKVFVEYLSPLKQSRIVKKLQKEERELKKHQK